ncbi:MAG: amidohydrolase family protein [Planctomycetaceae bacterium]|nr:amidohydrolase family protein [Planctomycetaceae bacterium]
MLLRFGLFPIFMMVLLVPHLWAQQTESSRHEEGLHENAPDAFVLKGAKVVVSPGNVMEDAVVVIRGGRIVSVRNAGDLPAGHRVIDLTGKTIYPGFIDGYSEQEIVISEAPEHARYWNANIRPERDVTQLFAWEEDATEGLVKHGITAALVTPGAGIFKGQAALVLATETDPERSVLASQVAQAAELTVQRRFGGPRIYPSSPMGAVALARQAMYDAQWYANAWAAANQQADLNRPERNASLETLGKVLRREQPLLVSTSNELMVLRADRFAKEFNVPLMIVGNGNEYRRLAEIAALKRPLILPVNFASAPAVGTPEDALNVSLESLMHWDLAPENPARLNNAGVEFAFTTNGLDDKSEFLKRIKQAVKRGLPADKALAALTTVPAKYFGVDTQVGTIANGKLANLVVTDGDLFAEGTEVVETWVAGQRHKNEENPARKIAGKWQVQLGAQSFVLQVDQDGSSLKGKINPPDADAAKKESEATADDDADVLKSTKSLVLIGTRLSGSFKSNSMDMPGTAQFSLIVNADNDAAMGYVIWPDGRQANATATLLERSQGSDDKSKTAKSTSSDAAKGRMAGKGRGKGKRRGGGKRGGGGRGNAAADFSEQPASFPVNYPLGAFGVTESPQMETVLFENATVWTCSDAGILQGAAVLISNGKIAGIYAAGQNRPVVDKVIDCTGKHLTPGIIDCHSHFASDSGINEGSQAITSEVRIGDFIDCDDITIYRQLAGGVTGSNILHGSANPIGGQNQVVKLRWGMGDEAMKMSEAPQGIKFALGENVKRSRSAGSRRSGDSPPRYPTTRMGVEQLMHDTFRAAQQYKMQHQKWNANRQGLPPRRDLELDAIVEILDGNRWIHCHSYRQDEILALIRVLDEYGITIGTFQHILEGYKVADKMAEHGAMASAFSDWWAYKFEVYDAIPYAGKLMHDAGVVVSFNSDDGELATHLNQEAAKAVKYGGVPEQEALKFVTLNPAKQLRIDQYVGSIDLGKHADLALWNGPPLSAYSRCQQTWVDGRKYFDVQDDAAARQATAGMRQTLVQKILNSGEQMRADDSRNDDPQNLWPRYDEYCRSHLNQSDDAAMMERLQEAWLAEEEE